MNQFNIQHSFPGICTKCFTEVAEFNGSNQWGKPLIVRYKPNYFGIVTMLDDGSEMTITLCSDCANTLSDKDYNKIMKSEIAGWEYELQNCLKTWKNEKKKDYRNKYYKLKITGHHKSNKKKRKVG